MIPFLVVRLLHDRGSYRAFTYCLRDVEVRSPSCDLPEERGALEASAISHQETINLDIAMRLATVVEAKSEAEAIGLADEKFIVPLDLLKTTNLGISKIRLLSSGFVKNLVNQIVSPITFEDEFNWSNVFHKEPDLFRPMDLRQWLLSSEVDLSSRYLRSIHWSGNASHDSNIQTRMLARWFAVEALWKASDQDNIVPILRWSLGFPNGSGSALISPALTKLLHSHSRYDFWRRSIENDLEEIRVFRNKSVHNGYRAIDVEKSKLLRFDKILMLGCVRSQALTTSAITLGFETMAEAKEFIPLIFERSVNVQDIHGTVFTVLGEPIR